MDVVVDTSVIIAAIAGEARRECLIEAVRGADLIAPPSVHWEIGKAFSAMLRRGRITLQQALAAIEIYSAIAIRFVDVELRESLEIARASNIYGYDAYLIRCALKYDAPLLSLDGNLLRAAKQAGVSVIEVSE